MTSEYTELSDKLYLLCSVIPSPYSFVLSFVLTDTLLICDISVCMHVCDTHMDVNVCSCMQLHLRDGFSRSLN